MSRIEKLVAKALNNPSGLRFSELCHLAEAFGFSLKGGKGSHRVYSRKGIANILTFQDVKGKAKPYQVRQLLKLVEDHHLEVKEK